MSRETSIQKSDRSNVPVQASTPAETQTWSYVPQIDVLEATAEYTIVCDAPGLSVKDINLTFDHGVLHIDGRVPQRVPDNARYVRQEYGVGDFYREVGLGRIAEVIDGERISAEYHTGVLTVHLPKIESAQPRRIQVRTA